MNEMIVVLVPVLAGVVLGIFFFAGLWWTVQKGMTSQHPAALFLGSLLLRVGVTLAGFYLVAQGYWQRLLLCLLGFILARFVVTRLTGVKVSAVEAGANAGTKMTEGSHAPES